MELITSRRNAHCIHAKKLGANRAYRNEHYQFLCDGWKLLEEAIKCNAVVKSVFSSSPITLLLPESTMVYSVSSEILNSLSPLKNSQDVLFVCEKPQNQVPECKTGTHLLLDNVQDPGNVGTIIRSADAFGIDSIMLTGNSADPYNPKAVRASMGAIFRQRIYNVNLQDITQSGAKLIGTSSERHHLDISKANLSDSIIVLGNEGQGISNEISALCDYMITLPISSDCESLNVAVAASIIMWEAHKQCHH